MLKKIMLALAALALVAFGLSLARPASANQLPAIDLKTTTFTCPMPEGFYANEDEQDRLPKPVLDGLLFEGKDLIHHKTDLDFTDFDKTNKDFTATKAGKVVFKAETSGPYSTIIINADGKLWSTAFKPEAEGGQNNPVAKAEDLIGKPDAMKPGKVPYTAASRVTTFGVGYWTEEGDTIVSSISFHGHKYDLTCTPPVTTTPATTKPPVKTTPATPSHRTSTPVGAAGGGTNGTSGGALAITGPSTWMFVGAGAALLVGGWGLMWLVNRRRMRFTS